MNAKAQMIVKNSFSCVDALLDRSVLRVLPARDLLVALAKMPFFGEPGAPPGEEDAIMNDCLFGQI